MSEFEELMLDLDCYIKLNDDLRKIYDKYCKDKNNRCDECPMKYKETWLGGPSCKAEDLINLMNY